MPWEGVATVSLRVDVDVLGWRAHTCKGLDLLSNYFDTSVVTGIELKDHLPHVLFAVYPPCQREDCGCLARSGRPVEEKMW